MMIRLIFILDFLFRTQLRCVTSTNMLHASCVRATSSTLLSAYTLASHKLCTYKLASVFVASRIFSSSYKSITDQLSKHRAPCVTSYADNTHLTHYEPTMIQGHRKRTVYMLHCNTCVPCMTRSLLVTLLHVRC